MRARSVCFLAVSLFAQQPAPQQGPRFEVVSVKPVPPNSPPVLREQSFTPVLPGGQYVDSRADLFFMIAFAYDIKNAYVQLTGLPGWAKNQSFDVSAKPPQGFPRLPASENAEQVHLMMRAMLADRFHLQLHSETRQEQVFALEVAKGGIRIPEAPAPVLPEKEGLVNAVMGNVDGRIIGEKSTMAGFARMLVIFLKRPVVDRTGLKGFYDIDVKWRSPDASNQQLANSGFGTEGTALLISVLQDQLRLRLTKTVGPVEYWVVDHVEQPAGELTGSLGRDPLVGRPMASRSESPRRGLPGTQSPGLLGYESVVLRPQSASRHCAARSPWAAART